MKRRIISFTTDRRSGNARSVGTLERLLHRQKLPAKAATAQQVHGSVVRIVPRLGRSKKYPAADGLLSAADDQPLAIFTADCVPVFLASSRPPVVGVLHAGWRGVRRNILRQAVSLMRRRWKCRPSDISVWIGPAIGACCFVVQWDVARFFPQTRRRHRDRWKVDLAAALKSQARQMKLRWLRQDQAGLCTMHDDRFYSFRRQPSEDRQVSVILQQRII